jgi:cell wall-associated NlpC family hydrolase
MDAKNRLIYFAKKHLGKSYTFGANPSKAPKTFDCSSFVQYVYKRIGINLPRTALDQASVGKAIESKKELLEIGDLLFFKGGWGHYNPQYPMGIGHVGIYTGNGKVIDARSKEVNGKEKGVVIEEDVESFLNRKDFVVVKRILGLSILKK